VLTHRLSRSVYIDMRVHYCVYSTYITALRCGNKRISTTRCVICSASCRAAAHHQRQADITLTTRHTVWLVTPALITRMTAPRRSCLPDQLSSAIVRSALSRLVTRASFNVNSRHSLLMRTGIRWPHRLTHIAADVYHNVSLLRKHLVWRVAIVIAASKHRNVALSAHLDAQ